MAHCRPSASASHGFRSRSVSGPEHSEQTWRIPSRQLRGDAQVLEASILSTCQPLEIYNPAAQVPEQGITAVGSSSAAISGLDFRRTHPQPVTVSTTAGGCPT